MNYRENSYYRAAGDYWWAGEAGEEGRGRGTAGQEGRTGQNPPAGFKYLLRLMTPKRPGSEVAWRARLTALCLPASSCCWCTWQHECTACRSAHRHTHSRLANLHKHSPTNTHVHVRTRIRMHTHTHMHAYRCEKTQTHAHPNILLHTHTQSQTHTQNVRAYKHTLKKTHTCTHRWTPTYTSMC